MTASAASRDASAIIAESAAARVSLAPPVARLSLRARGDLAPLETAMGLVAPGLALPARIGSRARADGPAGPVEALCLGPDEWMLHTAPGDAGALKQAFAEIHEALPHSLVEVSGREVTFALDGPRAAELLTLGMPRDPESIAVGEGRRTVFDDATVILWRDAETVFRMDCWRSFAPHLRHLLEIGCRELAAENS